MKSIFTLFFLALISSSLDAQHKPLLLEQNQKHQRINFTLSSQENSISLCNLTIENTYRLIINNTYEQESNVSISLANTNTTPSTIINFTANSPCEEVFFTFQHVSKKERQLTLTIVRADFDEKIW